MSQNKNHSGEPDFFYDMPAVWALEPQPLDTGAGAFIPSDLLGWFAAVKHTDRPVGVVLRTGETWRLRIRAVATSWISGETHATYPRGMVIAIRAIAALDELPELTQPGPDPVTVSMLEGLAHSLRVNPHVVVASGPQQWVGVVTERGDGVLQLHTRPGLDGITSRVVIPEHAIDYVRFIEPGDSF